MNEYMNRRQFFKNTAIIPTLTAYGLSNFPAASLAQTAIKRVNGAKLKLTLNAYSFNRPLISGEMTLDELLELSARLDFDAVDLTAYYFPKYPELPDDALIYHIKRKAFLLGLDISGTGVRNDFTRSEKEKRENDLRLVKKWIECAAKLGAPVIRIFTGRDVPDGYTWDQVAEWVVDNIQLCAEYGEKFGVMVAIQNHADFLQTAEDVLKILKWIDSPWVGIMLDVGSFRTDDPYADIARVAPYAITWQIKENVYIRDKQVETDLKKLVQIFGDVGYRGYLPVETLGEGDPKIKVPKFLAKVRSALYK